MVWTVHFANASGHLDPFEAAIRASVEKARLIGEQAMPPVSLDLVVQNWPGRTIPELGFMGYAPTSDMIAIRLMTKMGMVLALCDAANLPRTVWNGHFFTSYV